MSVNLLKLSNVHRHVMRQLLASGGDLKLVCEQEGLNYDTWKQTVASPLFSSEMMLLQEELDARAVEQAAADPVHAKLRAATSKAVDVLVGEMDNFGQDASSLSRQKASTSILDRAGYSAVTKSYGDDARQVVINISESKVAFVAQKVGVVPSPPCPLQP